MQKPTVKFAPHTYYRVIWCPKTVLGCDVKREEIMNNSIHPEYTDITATCACGNVIKTKSTICKDISLDVCSACHPFYTGKQKMLDTGGRVDKFRKRFGSRATK
jgi:large subunit ribosomal protein L31